MGTLTLRPNRWTDDASPTSVLRANNDWTMNGGGGSVTTDAALLADASDATYGAGDLDPPAIGYSYLWFDSTLLPAAAGQPVWTSLTLRMRSAGFINSEYQSAVLRTWDGSAVFRQCGEIQGYFGYGSIEDWSAPASTAASGDPITNGSQVNMPVVQLRVSNSFSTSGWNLYAIYVDAVYNNNALPVNVAVSPAGDSRPTISWAVTDTEGDAQAAYIVSVYNAATYSAGGFDPVTSWASALLTTKTASVTELLGANAKHQFTDPLPTGTAYRAYVSVRDQYHPGRWRTAYVQFDVTAPETGTVVSIVSADPSYARVHIGPSLLLSQNGLAADTTPWTGQVPVNASASTDAAVYYDTPNSLKMTSSAAGDMSVFTVPIAIPTYTADSVNWSAQAVYGLARFKTAVTPRNVRVDLLWWKAGGTASTVRASDTGTVVVAGTENWVQASVSGIPPSDAVTMSLRVVVIATGAAGEVHNIDQIALQTYSGTQWVRANTVAPLLQLQRQDGDASQPWRDVVGASSTGPIWPAAVQLLDLYDNSLPPNTRVRYRWRITQYQSDGVTPLTGYGAEFTAGGLDALPVSSWWLKDPSDLTSSTRSQLKLSVRGALRTAKREAQARFRPLGRTREVVLSDGVVGDEIQLPLNFYNQDDFEKFEALRALGRTLVLLSDTDVMWWVHLGETREAELANSITRKVRPYRSVDLTAVEVNPLF